MRKKLEGNGLWESSRMMLPEHKEANIRKRRELQRRNKIELDEQELEQIQQRLLESQARKTPVKVRVYDPYEQQLFTGHVERIHVQRQQILVGGYWIDLRDIEAVETC